MSFLANVKTGKQPGPRRTVIFALHGWGKSILAAQYPNPIFLDLEDGLNDLDVARGPVIRSIAEAWEAIEEIRTAEHDFGTLVVDSVDWFERLAHIQVCSETGKRSVAEVDYGKGYNRAYEIFCECLNAIDRCRTERGMFIVLLAHTTTKKIDPPGKPSYTKHTPKMRDDVTDKVCEWCDEILFGDYRVDVRTEGKGFNERGIAIGKGERILYTQEGPGHVAKNRLGLPKEIIVPEPFTPEAAAFIKQLTGGF